MRAATATSPRPQGAEPLAEWEQELLAGATATASPTAEGAEPGTPEADVQTEPKPPTIHRKG